MKKIYFSLLLAFTLAVPSLHAQSVLFKPGPANGIDAMIMRNDVCSNWDNQNYGLSTENDALAWTWYALNCGPGAGRSLIRFTGLNTLPPGAVITYAELRLFGVPTSGNYQGNSQYPGSPFGTTNDSWVRRITSSWSEMGVTWNGQPSITTADEVAVPGSASQWNYDVSLDVTNQVIAMMAPGQNHGFMLMLDDENYYRSLLFASSDHADSKLWPELYVRYTLPCDANFSYCTSTQTPGLYHFSVDNPNPDYTYTWYFENGSAYGPAVDHAYLQPGTYDVCLEAVNEKTGEKCRVCTIVCVREGFGCHVRFIPRPLSDDGLDILFRAQTYGLHAGSYYWDFGDGSTSKNGPNERHHYDQPGVYTVCLTVKYDDFDCEARYCRDIVVGPADGADAAAKATGAGAQLPHGDRAPFTKNIQKLAGSLKVSPNPTGSATITATIDAAVTGTYKYVVYDAQGKPALTGSKGLVQGMQNIQLQVKELQPGKYWIEFSNNRQQLRTGFVKL